MKFTFQLFILLLTSVSVFAQSSYSGFIDKYPIELATYVFSDGDARAVYAYSKYDNPMVVNGRLKEKMLTLYEKDDRGKDRAILTFENFDEGNEKLKGSWKDLKSGKQLPIVLTKDFDVTYGENIEWTNRELIQPVSLKDKYFKLMLTKDKDNFYARVTGVKVLEKKTDKLIQQIDVECQLWGLGNISIGDYNFDGIEDFSVFEQSYAGPNTSSLYFLYNPKSGKYFDSGFRGTSLEFDQQKKRIYEHNQCCAGRSHMNEEYKLVNNQMVLVKQTCLEYDEKTEELKDVKCN